jgi:hypothetical protein
VPRIKADAGHVALNSRNMKRCLFYTGCFLLGLNLVGFFIPLRNPEVYSEKSPALNKGSILTENELYDRIRRGRGTDAEHVLKVNAAVHQGIAHYWKDEGIANYNLRIPIHENYLLFFVSYLYPAVFEKHLYYDYRKAIERGIGLCAQQALIAARILEEQGIASRVIGLAGHVVATALVDKESDTWWVIDPDYGVVVRRRIEEIEIDPAIIRPYYAAHGYDQEKIDVLVQIYEKEGNRTWDSAKAYYSQKYYVETGSYLAIWVIPVIMLLPRTVARSRALFDMGQQSKTNHLAAKHRLPAIFDRGEFVASGG